MLLIAAVVAVTAVPAFLFGEEPGWYRVQLADSTFLTARLLNEEGNYYVFSFEGAVLRVEKKNVRGMQRLTGPENEAAAPKAPEKGPSKAPRSTKAGDKADKGKEVDQARADQIRNAVESLGEAGNVEKAYQSLSKDFEEARPFLHAALSHQSPRVRTLATKLLGEKGAADEDLVPVAGRLADPRPEVRLAATMAVRALGPKGLQALVEYLDKENVPNNRKMAVKTFQRWNDPRAVAPLVERLSREKDKGVQGFIEVALESLTGKKLGRDPQAWAAYLTEEERHRELDKLTEPPESEVKIMEGPPGSKE